MILAIDLGSTSFKAAIFDRRLRLIGQGRHRLIHHYGAGGSVEIEIDVVHAALRGALSSAGMPGQRIEVMSITSQAQTFTLVDQQGRPHMPFVSWQDGRAVSASNDLKRILKLFGDHSSFGEIIPGLQMCQLRRVRPGRRFMALNLPSYVLRLLTGESVTDNNIAAMSGLYSLREKGWWPAALRACHLGERQLPRVIDIGQVAAMTTKAARRFGIPEGIPVVLAGNDQTAGGYAAQLENHNSLLLTLGTAHVVYACLQRMPLPRPELIRGPYPGGLFYRMGADNCGGNVVNWAKTVLAGCEKDQDFFKMAAKSPTGSRGLVFEASLDAGAGCWRNLGLHHTPGDMAHSILESLSRRLAGMVRQIGYSARGGRVLAAGGGSKQGLWRRLLEMELGVPLVVTKADPLLGAARMARGFRLE